MRAGCAVRYTVLQFFLTGAIMNKIVKFSLIGAGVVVGIVLAGASYLALTFDPNDYKNQIIQIVNSEKQRNLHLDGPIGLSFFPNIGVNLERVSLSEYKSEQPFVSLENARVSLALMPLLSKHLVVNEVLVSGLSATLIKHRDGTTNIDDLLGKDEKPKDSKSPLTFDIAAFRIEKTKLTYRDEGSGAQYHIADLNLKTGRIANGVPGNVALSARVQANQPKLDIIATLKSGLTFDLERSSYQLTGMDMQVNGAALDVTNLKLNASGDASANLSAQEFAAHQFKLSATGVKAKDNFDVSVAAPELSLNRDKFTGRDLQLNAKLDGAPGHVVAALSLPELQGNEKSFKVAALKLDLDVKQAEQAFKVALSSPLTGNFRDRQFDLGKMTLAVQATGDKLPNKSVNSQLTGRVEVDALKQAVQANLAGGLLQSQIVAHVGVKDFEHPAIDFDLVVDQFDADLYLPKKPASKTTQPETPIDLSALRPLNLDGSVRIGKLKAANIKLSDLKFVLAAHHGLLKVSPLSANLYQGGMQGSLLVNATGLPNIQINQTLSAINVAALTRDAASFDTLEGRGTVLMHLSVQGNTVSAMKKAMNGSLSLNLTDGAIKGINIAKKLRDAQSMLGKTQTQSANQSEKTDFSELKASFKVNNGVAHNDDLSLKSPLLRLAGNGDIDVGQDSMNYLAKATLAKTLEGQGGRDAVGGITVPVRVSGPFSDLKYTLDFGAMVSEAAKQKVEAKKQEVKTRLQDQFKNSLKGLFK